MTWATHDGWKHGARCVIAGEPSFHQAGAVITHQGGGLFVVAHGVSSETNTGERAHAHSGIVSSSNEIPCLFGFGDWRYCFHSTHEQHT